MKRTLLLSEKNCIILFLFLTLLLCTNSNAQTVLISPTGDGGFETGTTFAANGWTAVNTASTVKAWYVGTGQTGFTGARSAFIGDNSTTVGSDNSARIIHIYRSITVPAGATNINLSFKYKQEVSDYFSGIYYDYITVYTNNTAPVSGTSPNVGGSLQFGPYPTASVPTYTSQNTTLPNSLAGTTTNLIFTFRSDAVNPRGFGAVDDVSLTYTPAISIPTITSLGATSGCVGSSITINGTNLTGATAVAIGGTAVSSITSNTATQIIAVIGAGTTGTVSVTTAGGTANSAAPFTVNTVPAQPSTITGNTTPCSGTSQVYSVTNVAGTTYTWAFPAGWTQTAGGTTYSVTVTTNGTAGNISVTPSNACGNGTIRTLAVAPTTVPAQPSTITGATAACVTGSRTYSVTNVAGTAYTWSLPLGWIQTGGTTTNSITVTAGATGGTISVTPSNSCGNGSVRTLAVSTISGVPSQPSTITGNTTPCATTSQTYSVTNVAGTTYTWVFPSGWVQTAGGTTNSITVTPSTTAGNITVTPSNDCGNGTTPRTLAVTPTDVPAQPSTITGNVTICSSSSQIYSVTSAAGVTYVWAFPAGWVQTAGGTTSSVTVTTNGTSGNVSVTPSNACGNGTTRTLAVTPTTVPGQPSTITGNATPCIGASLTYSVTNISGTTYSWILPSGWSQTAGGTTSSITVTVGATAGNIEVIPSNTCGSGTARTFSASPIMGAAQPSTITGSTTTCQGTSLTYSVTNIAGVTYTWTFPVGWTQTAGGTTSTITVTAGASSGNIQVTPSTACGSGTARTLAVTATAIPTITSTTPGSRTGIGTVNLSAAASGGTISWYANLTGGSALGTGNNFTTPGIITTTTYYVDSYNGLCGSSPRIAVVATVNFPEISVSGNGFNIVDEDITPITTDFTNLGTANMGFNLSRTYTIQNSGTVDLSIGTINIGGINSSDFVVTTPPSATVIPGGSTTFTITFTPTAIGTRNANVSFVTNDPDENPFNFDIAGTGGSGVIPEINVQGLAGNDILDGDSGSTVADGTDFGSVTIPGTITRTFTIQNTGTGPLLLTGTPLVVLTGSSNFVVTTQPSSNIIPAGGNLTFQITFNPTVTGSSVALVSINNNDSNESIYDFAITGAAVVTGREIDIQGNEISIIDGDVTPSVADQTNFGITDSVTPIPLTYNVYSFGSSTLTINATVAITGPNASQFTAPNIIASGTSLASGAVTSFVVTFTPTASLGVKTATVTITSNDPDEGTYNFDISAEVQTLAPLTVAPGGITSNLKFWLKANSSIGTVTDNTTITTWPDQTYGSTKNAVAPFSKEPKFQNNPSYNVNFNPVIHFNGNNTMSGGQGFNNSDMFIVVKPTNQVSYTSSPQDIYSGDDTATNKGSQDVTGFQMGNTSARHNNDVIAYNQ
ncbi:MAG: choice-of-anchor D domain-containing protein, partial [Flavobacterium sp.]|nr:choice-of-anchor D domain-containing protein [Flavobacterium sp.]